MPPPQIPYFNAPIFLENKTQVGKVDEILGQINSVVRGTGGRGWGGRVDGGQGLRPTGARGSASAISGIPAATSAAAHRPAAAPARPPRCRSLPTKRLTVPAPTALASADCSTSR